jgi:uncharacterized protein YuzE
MFGRKRGTEAMTDVTYDAAADAVYITVGRGKISRTEEAGPFRYDVDARGHIVGIEIPSASKALAPGDWKRARRPKENARQRVQAAEWHRGFIFIKRSSLRAGGPRTES